MMLHVCSCKEYMGYSHSPIESLLSKPMSQPVFMHHDARRLRLFALFTERRAAF